MSDTTHTTWNPMLPSGVTADDIQHYMGLLDDYNFAGLDAIAEACGFVWQLGTAWWADNEGMAYGGSFKCVVYGFTRDRDCPDDAYDDGEDWRSPPSVTEPAAALREALRLALEAVARRFEDVEVDEG